MSLGLAQASARLGSPAALTAHQRKGESKYRVKNLIGR